VTLPEQLAAGERRMLAERKLDHLLLELNPPTALPSKKFSTTDKKHGARQKGRPRGRPR
jgi:hypothetical protein